MKSVSGRCKATTHSYTKSVLGGNKLHSMKTTRPRKKLKADPSCLDIQDMKTSAENSKILQGQSQQCCQKIKLQLFPMDDTTKNALEQDNHNPYLELTLTARKKISSVVRHLNIKWGISKAASGELTLFPYQTDLSNLTNSRRWTVKDSNISAADVHASLGSPTNFRLRYGWYSDMEKRLSWKSASNVFGNDRESEKSITSDIIGKNNLLCPASSNEKVPTFIGKVSNVVGKPVGNKDEPAAEGARVLWTDGISNISFGALMSELSQTSNAGVCHLLPAQKNTTIQQFPNTCDSFDAAIAALIARQGPISKPMQPPPSSIWEAEETCHPFPFAKSSSPSRQSESLFRDTSNQNTENNNINPLELPIAVCPQQEQAPTVETCRKSTIKLGLQIRNDCAETITNFQTQCRDCLSEEPKATLAFQAEPSDYDSIALGDVGISSTPEVYLAPCSRERSGGSADTLGFSGLIASSMDAFQDFSIF